jgi:hypothetical protein
VTGDISSPAALAFSGIEAPMSTKQAIDFARAYLTAGLSPIPIRGDGTKEPDLPAGNDVLNRRRRATEQELADWYVSETKGVAVLAGSISGDLECIDFDRADIFPLWAEVIREESPDLFSRLTVNRSPRGWHVVYRCPGEVEGNQKLAQEPDPKAPPGKPKPRTLIETRGDGGYFLAPGCPACCHDLGGLYVHHSGPPLEQIATITADERELLLDHARERNTWVPPERPRPQPSSPGKAAGTRPGDDFNANCDWKEILEPEGWNYWKHSAGLDQWTRPGKSKGTSATTGLRSDCGKDLFHVFSSNAYPFESDESYSKFAVYTMLRHNGDYSAAARALAAAGWGKGYEPVKLIINTTSNGETNGTGTAPTATPAPPPEPWEQPIPLNAPPSVPPFPLDIFPPPLRSYAGEVAFAVNAPVDFVAVPMLVAAAGAIGNSRWLAVTRSHRQPPVLFAAIIGRPGSGKSTPLDFVLGPLHAAEAEFYREWEKAKQEWDDRDNADKKEPRPKLRRCLVDDTTVEALCRILAENPRGALMARDELAALVTGLNQYRDGGKGNDRQIFLKIWSASPVKVDRSKLEGVPLTVRRPCLSIVGGIQPAVIDWLRGEQVDDRPPPDDGFFDRFLVSYPIDLPAIGEQWREVPWEAATAWQCTLQHLLDLKLDVDEASDKKELLPRGLSFTDEGRSAWARETQAHADEVNHADFRDWLRGPWQKLCPGYVGRLALVLQLLHSTCNTGSSDRVEGQSVEDAFRLVAYFKDHARKIYAIMAADPCMREAAHVLRWLMRNTDIKVFSRRDAHRHLAHTFARSETLDAPLTRLVEHGYLRSLPGEQRSGPGRKASMRYEVNTLWERRRIDTIDGIDL